MTGLNPAQEKAVTHAGGPVLVLAGAGSGKTRVITHRIAHLVRQGTDPKRICAVTFTNKAAGEMRERIAALMEGDGASARLRMGTFHSLGLHILRKEYKAAGLTKSFAIYDTGDQLGILRELSRRAGLGRKFDLKAVLSRISLAKNSGILPEDYVPDAVDEYDEATEVLYPKYQEQLLACAAVDFDDLILIPLSLWRKNAQIAERWRSMYDYVLVDEFQDSNACQLELVEHLAGENRELFAVGDDDQSIYGWRGAEPRNIIDFDKRMGGAEIIKLQENYRSSKSILDMANTLIANNQDRLGKELFTSRSGSESIVHAVAEHSDAEAEFVGDEILKLQRELGCTWDAFAVLYRSNNLAAGVEEALRMRGIPYKVLGGQQFYERKEVKDVLAYLRVILSQRDDLALRRIINYPARGIGAKTVLTAVSLSVENRTSLYEAFKVVATSPEVRAGTRESISGFLQVIEDTRSMIDSNVMGAVRHLIDKAGIYDDIKDASPSPTSAQKRIDNVEHLIRSIDSYLKNKPDADLLEFVRFLSLAPKDEDNQLDRAQEDRGKVTLTTLHSAKGLEFPTVFFVGLEEGIIPHARTLKPTSADIFDPEKIGDISEERRLAYVGITRAKHRLYLTRAVYRALRGRRPVPSEPSRFLFELPEDDLVVRDIASEQAQQMPSDEVRNLFKQLADL